ncbi:MAG TPA: DCC1-like thiol-disulfide oxidoreductase family protein [Woeseiaceae bacterium]|nr:DCC1-like thiol-disulfide oxidoreductase family protein [Woeseiaceae bacterium]
MIRAPYSYRNDPDVPAFPDDKPLIIFDGYCSLCSGWAKFVLRHDRRHRHRLATAQSELGRSLYLHYGLDPQDYQTNILIEEGIAWFRSEGTIRMFAGLGWPWRAAAAFRILPMPLMDRLYNSVALHRLRLFGRKENCYVPAPDDADRFLS